MNFETMRNIRVLLIAGLLAVTGLSSAQAYDVIVVGSEPEGVAAAVAAAQEGASVILMTRDDRIGGLLVTGEMNSLDVRTTPVNYQRGLFLDWWSRVGMGHSYDVLRAEAAFEDMLSEAGVTVLRGVDDFVPLFPVSTAGGSPDLSGPVGVQADGVNHFSRHVIDATSEADFAADAGAQFTFGFESIGLNERMADTLVFRIDGVNWPALQAGIRARGNTYATTDAHVAWGHFGGYPARYEAVEPGIRLRGLNMGRQDDGTLLVNALLIHGIDPFDPESVRAGRARGEREAPRMIEYLSRELPGFENAFYAGAAETLYTRETRHLLAQCILDVDDVMDNRVTDRAIAAGGYPLDVQVLTPQDNGYVFGTPVIYGAELCVTVPEHLDNVWVVGKAAGYDPIAHSSARVVPFGIVVAEAAGVAAAFAAAAGVNPATFVADDANIDRLRSRLLERGAYLPPVQPRNPLGPWQHPHYDAYRLLLSRGLALGGYSNEPNLDGPIPALSYIYMLSNVSQRFLNNTELGPKLLANFQYSDEPFTAEIALAVTAYAACQLGECLDQDWAQLEEAGLRPAAVPPAGELTRGEMYAFAAAFAEYALESELN